MPYVNKKVIDNFKIFSVHNVWQIYPSRIHARIHRMSINIRTRTKKRSCNRTKNRKERRKKEKRVWDVRVSLRIENAVMIMRQPPHYARGQSVPLLQDRRYLRVHVPRIFAKLAEERLVRSFWLTFFYLIFHFYMRNFFRQSYLQGSSRCVWRAVIFFFFFWIFAKRCRRRNFFAFFFIIGSDADWIDDWGYIEGIM